MEDSGSRQDILRNTLFFVLFTRALIRRLVRCRFVGVVPLYVSSAETLVRKWYFYYESDVVQCSTGREQLINRWDGMGSVMLLLPDEVATPLFSGQVNLCISVV